MKMKFASDNHSLVVVFASMMVLVVFIFVSAISAYRYKEYTGDSTKYSNSRANGKILGSKNPTEYHEEPRNQYGETDIIVQTRMADATDESVDWGKWNALIGFGISILIVVAGYLQWKRDHDRHIQVERGIVIPYFSENPVTLIEEAGGFRLTVPIVFENFGKSPALRVRLVGQIIRKGRKTNPVDAWDQMWRILRPGVTEREERPFSDLFTKAQISSVRDFWVDDPLCVVGSIRYRDIFGNSWNRKFVWDIYWHSGKPYVVTGPDSDEYMGDWKDEEDA